LIGWGVGQDDEGTMKAPAGGGRAAVRSVGRLLERYRHCAAASPLPHARNVVRSHGGGRADFGVGKGGRWGEGALRDEVRAMQRILPVAVSGGRQLQPQRGFLGIGDGDEDVGLAKHFEEDRVFGYVC
jgi:hypothetical protein